MPEYLWGPLGFCMAFTILFPIFHYRHDKSFLALFYMILLCSLTSLWFLFAIILFRTFWGQTTILILLEFSGFAVFVMLANIVERHAVHRVVIKWCKKELNGIPDSLYSLTTSFFKSRRTITLRKGDTSWRLIIHGLTVVSATRE